MNVYLEERHSEAGASRTKTQLTLLFGAAQPDRSDDKGSSWRKTHLVTLTYFYFGSFYTKTPCLSPTPLLDKSFLLLGRNALGMGTDVERIRFPPNGNRVEWRLKSDGSRTGELGEGHCHPNTAESL